MVKLIFATNNPNKVAEIKPLLPSDIEVLSLAEAGISQDIPEPHDTIEANALEKMQVIHRLTGLDCFSEDTGLEVDGLNGAPGVKSARFAGDNASHDDNIDLLLEQMRQAGNRKARFRTVIALQWKDSSYLFEGICQGEITHERHGKKGFGYDPVFIPDGAGKTFAEMEKSEKAMYSHRAKGLHKLLMFLADQSQ
jgi:XTP/dITP diphosphohydrolase